MEQAIQLFGYLILTFLGFVVPIVGLLLSTFQEGLSKLTAQYESEKTQSEQNIREQLKKLAESEKTDVAEIEKTLDALKAIKRTAEAKLSYLNPRRQTFRLFLPLLISFGGVIGSLVINPNVPYVYLLLLGSLVCFVYAMSGLWNLLNIMVEVKKSVDSNRKDVETKTIELLSALVEKFEKGGQYFLRNVHIALDRRNIEKDVGEISLLINKKEEVKLGIENSEPRMAKNLEIGFTFRTEFIIERKSEYNVYAEQAIQIVRYNVNMLQGNTHMILTPVVITPLKEGDYKIRTFIKAENIESKGHELSLKVTAK